MDGYNETGAYNPGLTLGISINKVIRIAVKIILTERNLRI